MKDYGHAKEVNELRAENAALRKALSASSAEADRQASELQKLKDEALLAPVSHSEPDMRLIEALQSGPIQTARLLEALQIDPSDSAGLRAFTLQLTELERMGFITRHAHGWQWMK